MYNILILTTSFSAPAVPIDAFKYQQSVVKLYFEMRTLGWRDRVLARWINAEKDACLLSISVYLSVPKERSSDGSATPKVGS